jgi:hypothetical protein
MLTEKSYPQYEFLVNVDYKYHKMSGLSNALGKRI